MLRASSNQPTTTPHPAALSPMPCVAALLRDSRSWNFKVQKLTVKHSALATRDLQRCCVVL